jgi:PPP family 3-phenylpropionic acid transporter
MHQNSRVISKYFIGSQYFLYFGVLGIFLPYFNLYCYHIHFSGFQIGVLSAVRSIMMVAFSLIWGILADRFQARRSIYITCSFISMSIWALYFLTREFRLMLLITVVYGIFYAPIISFLEAFTMDVLGHEKKSYGRIRVWGSISFIIMVLLLGRIIDHYAVSIILGFIMVGSILQAGIAIKMPRIPVAKGKPSLAEAGGFFNKRVVIFLSCAFLMLFSHGAYYGFFSIHLENMGFSRTFIGVAWALASIAEILVMLKSNILFKRFSLETVLIFSFSVAVLRWLILFFADTASIIILSQLLHAMTYGTFHMASILYIDYLAPRKNKTLGQAVNNAVTYGLGLMAGFFLNGYLYEVTGSSTLFLISAGIALAGALLFSGHHLLMGKKMTG